MSYQPSQGTGVSPASAPITQAEASCSQLRGQTPACLLPGWARCRGKGGYAQADMKSSCDTSAGPSSCSPDEAPCTGALWRHPAPSACWLCLGTAGMQDKQSIFPKPHTAAQELTMIKGQSSYWMGPSQRAPRAATVSTPPTSRYQT